MLERNHAIADELQIGDRRVLVLGHERTQFARGQSGTRMQNDRPAGGTDFTVRPRAATDPVTDECLTAFQVGCRDE